MASLSLLHLFYSSFSWLTIKAPSSIPRSKTQLQNTTHISGIHVFRWVTLCRWFSGLRRFEFTSKYTLTPLLKRRRYLANVTRVSSTHTDLSSEECERKITEVALLKATHLPCRWKALSSDRKGSKQWEKRVPLTHMVYCEWRLIWKYTGHNICPGGLGGGGRRGEFHVFVFSWDIRVVINNQQNI